MVDQMDQFNHKFVDEIKERKHPDEAFFTILESIIRLNYRDENFNVDELSHLCRICKSHLREQIRHHYGFPPHFLIENIRLECALYLLAMEIRIEDLAESVGFGTAQTFRRAFKRRLNISPTEFRKLAGNDDENSVTMIEFCKNILWKYKNQPFLSGDFAS